MKDTHIYTRVTHPHARQIQTYRQSFAPTLPTARAHATDGATPAWTATLPSPPPNPTAMLSPAHAGNNAMHASKYGCSGVTACIPRTTATCCWLGGQVPPHGLRCMVTTVSVAVEKDLGLFHNYPTSFVFSKNVAKLERLANLGYSKHTIATIPLAFPVWLRFWIKRTKWG